MNDLRPAHLAYLTNPERGCVVLNLQEQGKEIERFSLNRDQLFRLNAETADILCKEVQR